MGALEELRAILGDDVSDEKISTLSAGCSSTPETGIEKCGSAPRLQGPTRA